MRGCVWCWVLGAGVGAVATFGDGGTELRVAGSRLQRRRFVVATVNQKNGESVYGAGW